MVIHCRGRFPCLPAGIPLSTSVIPVIVVGIPTHPVIPSVVVGISTHLVIPSVVEGSPGLYFFIRSLYLIRRIVYYMILYNRRD